MIERFRNISQNSLPWLSDKKAKINNQ